MPRCSGCGTFILWGGIKSGEHRFCGPGCVSRAVKTVLADSLSDDQLEAYVSKMRNGPCPRCHGEGPVDVHTSHSAISFLIMTQWKSTPHMCCRRCGTRAQVTDLIVTALVGWWGFPWGLIATPLQIGRNLTGIFGPQGRDAGHDEEIVNGMPPPTVRRTQAWMTASATKTRNRSVTVMTPRSSPSGVVTGTATMP